MKLRVVLTSVLMLVLFTSIPGLTPLAARPRSIEKATCSASCGTTSVTCTTSGTCTSVDRNCSAGQRGYVQCGTTKTSCPTACPIVNNCGANGICASGCSSPDPDCSTTNPCVDNPARGCYYVWSPQDGCCYTNNFGCMDVCI